MSVRLGTYSALGHGTFSVDASTALTLNDTAASGDTLTDAEGNGANKVVRVVLSSDVNLRWSLTGATPTSSTWHPLTAGDVLEVDVSPEKFTFIGEASGTVYVDYMGIS